MNRSEKQKVQLFICGFIAGLVISIMYWCIWNVIDFSCFDFESQQAGKIAFSVIGLFPSALCFAFWFWMGDNE